MHSGRPKSYLAAFIFPSTQVGSCKWGGPMAAVKPACCACSAGLQPRAWEIRWGGSEIRSLGGAYYADMTYLGHLSGVKDDLTALENLRISSALAGTEVDASKAHDALQLYGTGRPGTVAGQSVVARATATVNSGAPVGLRNGVMDTGRAIDSA